MKYSYRQVKDSYPLHHRESFFTRLVCRPMSFPISYVLVNLKCSAWQASVLSIFFAISSCAFICGSYWQRWIGITCAVLWVVLDCVDGNIARVTKSYSAMGDFIDAQSGYTMMAFIFFANGVAAFNTSYLWHDKAYFFIILGAISSISNILARMLNSKYAYCSLENKIRKGEKIEFVSYDEPKTTFAKIRIWVDFNLGLVGLLMPLMIVAQILNLFDIFTIGYSIYSLAGCIAASCYYAVKAK